jgi:hypothetical protein
LWGRRRVCGVGWAQGRARPLHTQHAGSTPRETTSNSSLALLSRLPTSEPATCGFNAQTWPLYHIYVGMRWALRRVLAHGAWASEAGAGGALSLGTFLAFGCVLPHCDRPSACCNAPGRVALLRRIPCPWQWSSPVPLHPGQSHTCRLGIPHGTPWPTGGWTGTMLITPGHPPRMTGRPRPHTTRSNTVPPEGGRSRIVCDWLRGGPRWRLSELQYLPFGWQKRYPKQPKSFGGSRLTGAPGPMAASSHTPQALCCLCSCAHSTWLCDHTLVCLGVGSLLPHPVGSLCSVPANIRCITRQDHIRYLLQGFLARGCHLSRPVSFDRLSGGCGPLCHNLD